jgi:hypothetical protein
MLAKVFKHGTSQQLGTIWPTWTRSITRLTSSAHAFESLKNEIHNRRSRGLETIYDDVVCSPNDKIDDAMSRHAGPSGHSSNCDPNESSRAFIAFGSNLGDRVGHIEKALKEMEKRHLKIKSVSGLYETDPMYVTNQDTFLNGVCEVSEHCFLSDASDVGSDIWAPLFRWRPILTLCHYSMFFRALRTILAESEYWTKVHAT